MLVATPFEKGPAALSTRADLYGDECDEYVECFRHLEAQSTFTGQLHYLQNCTSAVASTNWRVYSSCQREIVLQCFCSIAPTIVPAKFHWQAICRIYAISFMIFMYVTCTLAKQSGGITLFFRTVEHMTEELTDPFHYRDDHMTNDRFQLSAVRMTEEPAY